MQHERHWCTRAILPPRELCSSRGPKLRIGATVCADWTSARTSWRQICFLNWPTVEKPPNLMSDPIQITRWSGCRTDMSVHHPEIALVTMPPEQCLGPWLHCISNPAWSLGSTDATHLLPSLLFIRFPKTIANRCQGAKSVNRGSCKENRDKQFDYL
ncbi:uncharacterized protein LOC143171159 [Aptenodytes patagonicus]|uniref:uncharacterized protein LOC143171159 n=1 Tax=Aptenodytes patagonicus TaxID=9234 RepID=UPI003FA17AEA